jgi:beta-glucosidase
VAAQADVVVLAIGGNEHTAREAYALDRMGDRASLDLIGEQNELIDAIAQTGKPIVALKFGGRPLAFNNLVEKADAIFECWYLGQETGRAVANVLFGDSSPGGKLPITVPRSAGHLPAYYNYKPSARRGYLYDDIGPLYPFGHGLSYTTFEFGQPRLEKASIGTDESTRLVVDVTNSGDRAGDEVVQMYIRDEFSSVTRPVKELKGFQRISLKPGETRTVEMEITPEHLAFWDINMEWTVEPGEFKIMVGPNSVDLKSVKLEVE